MSGQPSIIEVKCPVCRGDGMASKYDEGWRSFVHDPNLAAKRMCWRCAGRGWIPKDEPGGGLS